MKTTALAIALLFTTPALADVADDYAACLIGQAAVALQVQPEKKDASAAMDVAFDKCPEPTNMPEDVVMDGLIDSVYFTVEKIAAK